MISLSQDNAFMRKVKLYNIQWRQKKVVCGKILTV